MKRSFIDAVRAYAGEIALASVTSGPAVWWIGANRISLALRASFSEWTKFSFAFLAGSIALFVLTTRFVEGEFGQLLSRTHRARPYLNGATYTVYVQLVAAGCLFVNNLIDNFLLEIATCWLLAYSTITFLTQLNNLRVICLLKAHFESLSEQERTALLNVDASQSTSVDDQSKQ